MLHLLPLPLPFPEHVSLPGGTLSTQDAEPLSSGGAADTRSACLLLCDPPAWDPPIRLQNTTGLYTQLTGICVVGKPRM